MKKDSLILIVNNAEPGISEFTTPIEKIVSENQHNYMTIGYRECLNFDFKGITGIILTGSPKGDDIVEHHLPYFLWIKNTDTPVFGICAGHHITGFAFGSKLLRGEEPESGNFEVKIIEKDPIFDRLPEKFVVKQMHNDSITVPETFHLLATSEICKNQLMKHKTKSIYTCQFHPEYYNHNLIHNFLKICQKKTASSKSSGGI